MLQIALPCSLLLLPLLLLTAEGRAPLRRQAKEQSVVPSVLSSPPPSSSSLQLLEVFEGGSLPSPVLFKRPVTLV